jgi:putative phosphoesterase
MLIAVISDTHGTLHPHLMPALREAQVEMILHAGDVGSYPLLGELAEVAPVRAVRGNVDVTGRVGDLPDDYRRVLDGVDVYMTHVGGKPEYWLSKLPEPKPQVAICGHSHIPRIEQMGGVLFLNPGSAGTQPRFGGPLSFALLHIENGTASAKLITLEAARP